MAERPSESNFGVLFGGLVALLVLEPLGDVVFGQASDRLLATMLTILVMIGIVAIHPSGPIRWVGRALAAGTVLTLIATTIRPDPGLETAGRLIACGFFVLSLGVALWQVAAPGPVTTNNLLGAATVYLLLGLVWTIAYLTLDRHSPGSFTGLSRGAPSEYLYLSFVTLATLGYGDVTPVNPIARTLAYLEAVIGQLYVAFLVAMLVGRHVASRQSPPT